MKDTTVATPHKWDHSRASYGLDESYRLGMDFLAGCKEVEDWGCSSAYAKRFCKTSYIGVDGTPGQADVVVDLSTYQSNPEGIFMRHVLEHNDSWRDLLANALKSFTKRMTLVTFTGLKDQEEAAEHKPHKRPEWSHLHLPEAEFREILAPFLIDESSLPPAPGRKWGEQIWSLEKAK